MNLHHLKILLFLVGLSLSSCDKISSLVQGDEKKKNVYETHYKNGKIKSRIMVDEEKKRHGITTQYYNTGELKSQITYDHGSKTKAIQYYKTGKKQMEFNYKNGKKHGKRTKYWPNGEVQSVLEYDNNNVKKGLVEYDKEGNKITNYPDLIVEQTDNLNTRGEYIIQVYFKNRASSGNYYITELSNGVLTSEQGRLDEVNNKGTIVYRPSPGFFMMKTMNVVGVYRTPYGSPYIAEKKINVAIDF